MTAPVSATGAATPPAAVSPERAELSAAARQFEAIFVRQMLSEARKSHFGGDLFQSQGADTFRQMQDEHFADLAAERGAFGLARMIETQLAARISAKEPPDGI